jgi:polyphosphate kinase
MSDRMINRELSWLEFNRRVLEEAQDPTVPLLERVKFLSIFSSNLDEFFMVRVADLKQRIWAGDHDAAADGLSPAQTLAAVSERVHALVQEQHRCFLGTSSRAWSPRASGSSARRRSRPSRRWSWTSTSTGRSFRW